MSNPNQLKYWLSRGEVISGVGGRRQFDRLVASGALHAVVLPGMARRRYRRGDVLPFFSRPADLTALPAREKSPA